MSGPTNRPVSEWLADLEISEAQAAAGEFVPGKKVLADLQASIARLMDASRLAARTISRRRDEL